MRNNDQIKLGFGPGQIPHPGRSKQVARNSQEKGKRDNGQRQQGRCQRLLHYRPCVINWPAGNGDCPVEVRGLLSQWAYLLPACQERQRWEEKTGTVQRLFQASFGGVYPLETIGRRACWPRRATDTVQQHRWSHNYAGLRESVQEKCSQSRSTGTLLYSLPETHVRMRALPGQRLHPSLGSETAGTLPHRHDTGLRRRNGAGHAAGLAKTLCLMGCEYFPRRLVEPVRASLSSFHKKEEVNFLIIHAFGRRYVK